jgi:hypothetical protein
VNLFTQVAAHRFGAGPRCVGHPEFLRCLSRSHRLERLIKIAIFLRSGRAFLCILLYFHCTLFLKDPVIQDGQEQQRQEC